MALQILSLAQIDFRFYESTTRKTIRVDSIESTRIVHFIDESTLFGCIGQPSFSARENGQHDPLGGGEGLAMG